MKDTSRTIRSSRGKKTVKKNESQQKIFPKIQVINEKNKIKRTSRTSIRINSNQSHSFLPNHLKQTSTQLNSPNHTPKQSSSHLNSLNSSRDEIRMSHGFD